MNNKLTVKVLLLLGLWIINQAVFAEEKEDNRNPTGCNDVGYQFELKALKLLPNHDGVGQSLYVIYNQSNKPVTLFQMRESDSSHSMYFNHRINEKNYAILATCEQHMNYICTEENGKNAYGKIVDCKDKLRVCEYNHVKFGLNNKGNYWLVNSNSKNAAVREIVHYGIIPAINQ